MDDLKARLMQPALTSHYQCWFTFPDAVQKWIQAKRQKEGSLGQVITGLLSNESLENLSVACCDASLPGSTFQTHDVMAYAGVNEKFAYMRAYDDRSDFTFYVNDQYEQIKYFEWWMAYIADEQYAEESRTGLESGTYSYRMNFPNNYRNTIRIAKFERNYGGEKTKNKPQATGRTLEYIFKDAYPISIASIPVSYNSSELLKCTVSFTYSRYYLSSNKLGGITLPSTTTPGTVESTRGLNNPNDLLGQQFFRDLA